VSSPPASAAIRKAAPALAKAAGGKVLEVFLLEKPGSRNQDRLDPEEARRASEERALAELAKMSPEKRAAAQAQLDERQKLIAEMIVLTPEQRQNRISEYLSREDVQAGFEARMNEQVARMTPEQRVKHAQRYINYKKSVKDGGSAR